MLFLMLYQERNLDDLCFKYWEEYPSKLAIMKDGYLLMEQLETNTYRLAWTEGELRIRCLFRSKIFDPHTDFLGHALNWMLTHETSHSRVDINSEELIVFALFPESFLFCFLDVSLHIAPIENCYTVENEDGRKKEKVYEQ
jgi:hypothetical protein